MPLCKTAQGCSVQELASDPIVNATLNEYLTIRALSSAMENPNLLAGWLDDSQLMGEWDLLLKLEIEYAKWRERSKPKSQSKSNRAAR